jgi:hypothetical protein
MKKVLFFVLSLLVIATLTGCELPRTGSQQDISDPHPLTLTLPAPTLTPTTVIIYGPAATVTAIPPAPTTAPTPTITLLPPTTTPTPTATPTPAPAVDPTCPETPTDGTYVNVDYSLYLQDKDGRYRIPDSELEKWANNGLLVFEGEYSGGTHVVDAVVNNDEFKYQKDIDYLLVVQGSFWRYCQASYPTDTEVNDLLLVFAHDKWVNWSSQQIVGNPIEVRLTTGNQLFPAGTKPTLTTNQLAIAEANAQGRSPDSPQEETPLPANQADGNFVGALGSSSTRTLLVAQLCGDVKVEAHWWLGARDGVCYKANGAQTFLLPDEWGTDELKEFVEKEWPNMPLNKLP